MFGPAIILFIHFTLGEAPVFFTDSIGAIAQAECSGCEYLCYDLMTTDRTGSFAEVQLTSDGAPTVNDQKGDGTVIVKKIGDRRWGVRVENNLGAYGVSAVTVCAQHPYWVKPNFEVNPCGIVYTYTNGGQFQ